MLNRFLNHPVMGWYAVLLLAVIVATLGLYLTGHPQAAGNMSLLGTWSVVGGFGIYTYWHWKKNGKKQ